MTAAVLVGIGAIGGFLAGVVCTFGVLLWLGDKLTEVAPAPENSIVNTGETVIPVLKRERNALTH